MPFNSEQLGYGGLAAINYFLKNDPVDQINYAHPLYEMLVGDKQMYPGGKQYVVEQLRKSNDSNFQAYFGDGQVSYNRKRTLNQANWAPGSFHDGFGLNEDELAQNGIIMTDDRAPTQSKSEVVQLTNLFKENMDTLKLGFIEGFDTMLHRSGSQSTLEIPGLDNIVSTTPSAAGTCGGIDQVTDTYWRNYANTGITASTIVDKMEIARRACIQYGGYAPNKMLAGAAFIDNYRTYAGTLAGRQTIAPAKGGVAVDGSVSGVFFGGVEIVLDPMFEVLDALDSPTVPWTKRCYMLNTKFLKLRPINGHWMVPRNPPRVFDRYVNYWALTAKAALSTGKRNAHAVVAIA